MEVAPLFLSYLKFYSCHHRHVESRKIHVRASIPFEDLVPQSNYLYFQKPNLPSYISFFVFSKDVLFIFL
jgi:hypothetical protein